jgi:hypothetical protein
MIALITYAHIVFPPHLAYLSGYRLLLVEWSNALNRKANIVGHFYVLAPLVSNKFLSLFGSMKHP